MALQPMAQDSFLMTPDVPWGLSHRHGFILKMCTCACSKHQAQVLGKNHSESSRLSVPGSPACAPRGLALQLRGCGDLPGVPRSDRISEGPREARANTHIKPETVPSSPPWLFQGKKALGPGPPAAVGGRRGGRKVLTVSSFPVPSSKLKAHIPLPASPSYHG